MECGWLVAFLGRFDGCEWMDGVPYSAPYRYLPTSESLLTIWSDFLGSGLKKHTRFITRDYYERRSMLIIYAKSNWTNAQSSAIKMLVLLH